MWVALVIILCLAPQAGAGKHALLIGISDYRHTDFDSLDGPLNDVELVEEVLRRRFKVPGDHITRLTDAQANHSGLRQAFASLARSISPGDSVYIHYSGHGSHTPDLNNDEPSGVDQTWVSHGSRSRSGASRKLDHYDVLDDEIHQWLIPIAEKAGLVIMVSDSCHSASVSRGRTPKRRAAPADIRAHPQGHLHSPPLPDGVLRIGAARDDQSAMEFVNDDDRTYGLFTWFWVQALHEARPDETWEDVFHKARLGLAGKAGRIQRPQLTGTANRRIFGGAFQSPSKTVRVTHIRSDGKTLILDAGRLSGVTRGSIYSAKDGAQPAEMKIIRVKSTWSMGRLIKGHAGIGDGFSESAHVYPFTPLRVFVSGDYPNSSDKTLLEQLSAAIAETPGFTEAADQTQCDLILYVLRPKLEKGGSPIYQKDTDTLPVSFSEMPPQVWVLSPAEQPLSDKLRIRMEDTAKGIALLKKNLGRLARTHELDSLPQTPVDKFPLEIKATLYALDPTCSQEGADCQQLDPTLGLHRKQASLPLDRLRQAKTAVGDIVNFSLTNRSPGPKYIYLVEIQPDGSIVVIFPDYRQMAAIARLNPGQQLDLFSAGIGVVLEQSGLDKLRFIATRAPINIHLLEQKAFQTRGTTPLNPLEELLCNAAHGTRGRPKVPSNAWESVQIDLIVAGRPNEGENPQ